MRATSPKVATRIYETRVTDALDPLLVRLMLCEAYETGYADARNHLRQRNDR
jgi:hypothetical protein